LVGWEHVSVEPNPNPFLRLAFDSYPISHGLVAVLGWATLFAALYYGFTRYGAGAIVIWIGVHRPDLPLYAGGTRLVGMGLWTHRWWAIAVEAVLLAAGIWLYLQQTKAKDKIGEYAFWGFVVFLLLAYGIAAFGPPPPASVRKLAIMTLCTAVTIPWAWWFDSHREAREVQP
jgi:hypothetical protein